MRAKNNRQLRVGETETELNKVIGNRRSRQDRNYADAILGQAGYSCN
jgi:hypothetical protein